MYMYTYVHLSDMCEYKPHGVNVNVNPSRISNGGRTRDFSFNVYNTYTQTS